MNRADFLVAVQNAHTDADFQAAAECARTLGNEGITILKTIIESGDQEQAASAINVAALANLTINAHILRAIIGTLGRVETMLHGVALPELVHLAVNHNDAAGKALTSYVNRADSSFAQRYAIIVQRMGYNPRKHKLLPYVQVIEEVAI